MYTITRILAGDHLYGTADEGSLREDLAVHLAGADEILSQSVQQVAIASEPDSVTVESYEVKRWLKRLGDGDPRGLEPLFAPQESVLRRDTDLWEDMLPVATAQVSKRLDGCVSLVRRYVGRARRVRLDWPQLMHAIRVGEQTSELLLTGRSITFPRTNREWLLQVKAGAVPYDLCLDHLERLLGTLEEVRESSSLPPEPDREWAAQYVVELHRRVVLG